MQCDSGVGVGVPGLNQDPVRSGYFAIRVRCFPPVLILRCDRLARPWSWPRVSLSIYLSIYLSNPNPNPDY